MTNPDLEALEQYAKAIGLGFVLGAEEVAKQHGTIVAANGWTVASFENGAVVYRAILAFVIGPESIIRRALTLEPYSPRHSAVIDAASGKFVGFDGTVYRDEASFVAAMRFLAEAPGSRSTETAAH